MSLDDRLTNCAVIGAAGKMGRGIVMVLLQEMISTDLKLKRPLSKLICIDRSLDGLITLREYLDAQMLKFAERNISKLREWYSDNSNLVDNSEMIDHFLGQCRSIVSTDSSYSFLSNCQMVFEAVFENIDIKNSVYSELKKTCPESCLYFSNTSSIPISDLNTENDLNGKLIGFHFYNPPAIQKLVEVISSDENKKEDIDLSLNLIKRLKKLAVPSNDIAGFIGNGHFIREGLFYLREIPNYSISEPAAIYLIDQIVQKMLFRPMGMFQLIDYVGLDVFKMICETMGSYIDEDFSSELLDSFLSENIKGGQFGNGSQKDGFFKYDKGRISAVFDRCKKQYVGIQSIDEELSAYAIPELSENWKSLSRSRNLDFVKSSFESFSKDKSLTARKAVKYLQNSRQIAQNLVADGVADKIENVNDVMTNGFYHLYGPDSEVVYSIPEAKNE